MITWMQRHKKWLIITIWISTIAFVGAGFVGWGSYDYGKSNSTVAIVGDKEIPLTQLQSEYSALYSQYQQMFGENFNQELAKQLKLEDAAMQRIIQKYLLLNYADELGLATTDKEVAQELVKINAFLKDGKFDKNSYMSVLKQNKRSVQEFEKQIKQDLLAAKVQKIFNLPLSTNEIKNIGSLIYAQDRVSIKILNSKDIKVVPSNSDLKTYWDTNKNNYKSDEGFKISYTKIANVEDKDKKAMRKVALKKYLKLKKGGEKFEITQTIYYSSNFLPKDDFDKVITSKNGTILKPIYKDGNYYVIKLISKIKPTILPFDKVILQVEADYISQKTAELLDEKAKNLLKDFKGVDLGFINRESIVKIDGLSLDETKEVLQKIVTSQNKLHYINLSDKVVLYKIADTELGSYHSKNDATIKASVEGIKNNYMTNELLKQLQNKYKTTSFMGKN